MFYEADLLTTVVAILRQVDRLKFNIVTIHTVHL